ncbi:TolC family outer membrane protein [Alloalcanivorax gelatiniphagus]|uniref:TolC family outer membrane protein n=1 Tax=Alloalcanivorax gelatiniphagus TaxID=1194167 RepID=A0ABY2XLF5_9GAMM|nr:TolC family outer membrane protein [Alloalcanivorax gelatiniphagus]
MSPLVPGGWHCGRYYGRHSGRRVGWRGLLLVLCWALSPALPALTLEQAFDAALSHDAGFQAALQERQAGQEFKALGRANLLPSLTFTHGWAKNRSEVERDSQFGTVTEQRDYRSYNAALRLEQPLFDYGAWVARRIGNDRAARAELEFEARLQTLATDTLEAYTGVLLGRDRKRLAERQVTVLEALRERNGALVRAGEGTVTEQLETESRLALARAELIGARQQWALARRRLNTLTGLSVEPGTLPESTPRAPPLPAMTLPEWFQQARAHSPVLGLQRSDLRVAEGEVERQRAGHFPRLSLYASTRRTDSDSETTYGQHYDTDTIGLQLSVPLYDGGGVSAARRQAVARRAASEYRLREQRETVLAAVEQRWLECQDDLHRLQVLALAADSAEQLVTATRRSLEGGERNNQDLLEAQRQAHQARRDLAEVRYHYLNAWLGLHRDAGLLTVARLRDVSQALVSKGSESVAEATVPHAP